jgi:hypothetical protein
MMVLVETADGECGYFSLHLCEVDLEAVEVSEEIMEMELVFLLHS